MTGAGALGQLLPLTNVCNPGWYPPHGSVRQAHIVVTFLQTITLVSDKPVLFNYTVDVETQDGTATGTQECYINSAYSSPMLSMLDLVHYYLIK